MLFYARCHKLLEMTNISSITNYFMHYGRFNNCFVKASEGSLTFVSLKYGFDVCCPMLFVQLQAPRCTNNLHFC